MISESQIENVRYIEQLQSQIEKPELDFEDIIEKTQLRDAIYVYGNINILRPYGKNFVALAGIDVYNLYKNYFYRY